MRVEIYPRLQINLDNRVTLLGQHNFLQSVIIERDAVYAAKRSVVSKRIKRARKILCFLSESNKKN
jgi:hypothetical protein